MFLQIRSQQTFNFLSAFVTKVLQVLRVEFDLSAFLLQFYLKSMFRSKFLWIRP